MYCIYLYLSFVYLYPSIIYLSIYLSIYQLRHLALLVISALFTETQSPYLEIMNVNVKHKQSKLTEKATFVWELGEQY